MAPEQWQELERIYNAARERGLTQRNSFLEEACGGNENLRLEIESLLSYHTKAENFIEEPALEIAAREFAEKRWQSMSGRALGRYQIVSLLGAGGMGEVYRARDTQLDREVALKILPEHLATSPEARTRFEREAKAVAALSHPNILAIYDFINDQNFSGAVMELLEGETLRDRLARSPLSFQEVLDIAIGIGQGVAAAHATGIHHRDLKPENVFLTRDGRIKLLDFGLAQTRATQSSSVFGTLGYMAPEQIQRKTTDARSDIFSFGAMLFEMATGRRAFESALKEPPKSISLTSTAVPRKLQALILRCLQRDPQLRYQSMADVLVALRSIKARYEIGARRRVLLKWFIPGALCLAAIAAIGLWIMRPSFHRIDAIASKIEREGSSINLARPPCIGPPAGLVGWWPGDGNADDLTGHNPGTLVDGVRYAPGKVGRAFSFDGVRGYVDAGASKTLAPGAITVEFWMYAREVRPSPMHPAARWGHLQSRFANSWIFDYEDGGVGGTMSFSVQNTSSDRETWVSSVARVPIKGWRHVAGAFDPSERKIKIYLDGQLAGAHNYTQNIQANPAITSIGCKFAEGSCMYPFDGLIDEFSIYNRALSLAEIQAIFAAGSGGKCKPGG